MGHFYVKAGLGTCSDTSGEFGSAQSGAFGSGSLVAGAVYASVGVAINTGGAANGDFIYVSDAHAHEGAFGSTPISTAFPPLCIICVDDSNADRASVGTSVMDGYNNNDTYFYGNQYHYGMYWQTGDDMGPFGTTTDFYAEKCTFYANGSTDVAFWLNGDGQVATLVDCVLSGVSGAIPLSVGSSGIIEIFGGSVSGITSEFINVGGAINGKAFIRVNGMDLSSITGTLFSGLNSLGTVDGYDIVLNGCKLNASLSAIFANVPTSNAQRVALYQCAATSAKAEYQFHIQSRGAVVESVADNDTPTVYRNESTAFPSGRKVSAKCVTTSEITRFAPFFFDLPARAGDLSTNPKIRVYFASTTTLTDNDVWAGAVFADDTNNHEYLFKSARNPDPLAAGTEYTDDSGGSAWKDASGDLSGYNEYYLDIDTSDVGNGGDANAFPSVRIYVATDATIYFDTTIDFIS